MGPGSLLQVDERGILMGGASTLRAGVPEISGIANKNSTFRTVKASRRREAGSDRQIEPA